MVCNTILKNVNNLVNGRFPAWAEGRPFIDGFGTKNE